jgi:hypothetical protein
MRRLLNTKHSLERRFMWAASLLVGMSLYLIPVAHATTLGSTAASMSPRTIVAMQKHKPNFPGILSSGCYAGARLRRHSAWLEP